MSNVWKAGDDVMNTMRSLIANYHPHLAICDKEIAIIFKEKASMVGDAVVAGKSKKAPAILGILGETDYKFIIEIGADVWEDQTDPQKVALLDHHLSACRVEENTKTGELKYFIAPPDVSFYRGEIERHGFWRTSGAPVQPNLIEEMFGKDDD